MRSFFSALSAFCFFVEICLAASPASKPAQNDLDSASATCEVACRTASDAAGSAEVKARKDYVAQLQKDLSVASARRASDEALELNAEIERMEQDGAQVLGQVTQLKAILAAREIYKHAVDTAAKKLQDAQESAKGKYLKRLKTLKDDAAQAHDYSKAETIRKLIDDVKAGSFPGIPSTIDLLSRVDLKRDQVRGDFAMTKDGLQDDSWKFVGVLRTGYVPPEEYDVSADLTVLGTVLEGQGCISILFPHNSRANEAYIGNGAAGHTGVTGWDVKGGLVTRGSLYEKDQHLKLLLQVRHDSVKEFVDGKLVSEGKLDLNNKDEPMWLFSTTSETIGFATIYTSVEVTAFRVKEITKCGKWIQLAPLGDPPSISGEVPKEIPKKIVDVLALSAIGNTGVDGDWSQQGAELSVKGGMNPCKMPLRYKPPKEYNFKVTFTPVGGKPDCVALALVKDGARFAFVMGGCDNSRSWLGNIAGEPVHENETTLKAPAFLTTNRKYTCIVYVRNDYVAASIDGRLVAKYVTAGHAGLDIEPFFAIDSDLALETYHRPTVFHEAVIEEITGAGAKIP